MQKSSVAPETNRARSTQQGIGRAGPGMAKSLARAFTAPLGSGIQWAQQAGSKLGLGPRPDAGAAIDAIARLTHSQDAAEASQALAA